MPAKRSYYIDAPAETVFDFLRTMKWRDATPMEVSDVRVTEEGAGTNFSWSFRAVGLRFAGFDVFTEVVPDQRITERSAGAFPSTWVHTFQPEGTGTRWAIEFRPESLWRVPPLNWLAEYGFGKMSDAFAERFRQRVEALSGAGTQPAAAGEMNAVKRSIHIEAPVETVFDSIIGSYTDPVKLRDLVDVQIDDLKVTSENTGTYYTWRSRIAGLPVRGFDVLTDVVPGKHITDKSSNPIMGTWDYDLEPEGSGTRLTLEHHSRSLWNVPPMRSVTELAAAKGSDAFIRRLKETIEASAA